MSFENGSTTFVAATHTYDPMAWRKAHNVALLASYLWQPEAGGLDVPLMRVAGDAEEYYIVDGNKNAIVLKDSSGADVSTYTYTPFGAVEDPVDGDENPFRFSSEYHDDETSFVYYNYRYYSPALGRWLSRDPIEEEGGVNLYVMCQNTTIFNFDNLGFFSFNDVTQAAISFLKNHISGVGGISYTLPSKKIPVWSPPPLFLQANITFAGEAFLCQRYNKPILAVRGTVTLEGYLSAGISLTKGDPGKGRARNERIRNPNNPHQYIKRKKANSPPESGYRERNRYIEIHALENNCCPKEGVSFLGGNAFLRGSAGVGWGYQMNFQKRIDSSFTDLTQGWSSSAGKAWGITGVSVDAGISVAGQLVLYLSQG